MNQDEEFEKYMRTSDIRDRETERAAKNPLKPDQNESSKLPFGRICNDCAHEEICKWYIGIAGTETECDFYPSRFYDDVMTIYHQDGTKTEVRHPFRAMQEGIEKNEL